MVIDQPIAVPLMTEAERLELAKKQQPTQEQIKERMAKLIDTEDWNVE